MSYCFRIGFKEIKKDKVIDYCMSLLDDDYKNYKEIIKESLENTFFESKVDRCPDRKIRRVLCDDFIRNIFERRFIYWPEKELLGMLSNNREDSEAVYITFQNSCDQDYPYDTWKGLSCFADTVEKYRFATAEDILNSDCGMFGDFSSFLNYTVEDIESDLEYFRRTAVYEKIFSDLQLSEFIFSKDGNFQCFSMSALNNTTRFSDAENYLDKLLPKPVSKPETKWHSIKNTEDLPRPGEVVTVSYLTDRDFNGIADGVYTDEGFKILNNLDFEHFLIITAWKRKEKTDECAGADI